MTVIEVKENGAIRTKMLSCDSPIFVRKIYQLFQIIFAIK